MQERTGYLFPGQGAQFVGMGRELYEREPAVRALYEQAEQASGLELRRLSFEGPEAELTRTDVCQPAILLASLAALQVLRRLAPAGQPVLQPAALAGLSLGEYTALVAAGALEPLAAVQLVAARGRFMQQACEARRGAMASLLGAQIAEVEAVVAELSTPQAPVVVSNYNAPHQVVISGAAEAVERAAAVLLERRAARRVIALKVAGAYHSPLMEPAAEQLRAELERVEIRPPAVPVLSNVTGAPHPADEPGAIRELLARQVAAPVRWTDCLRHMLRAGIRCYYELGPGQVLAGTLRAVDDEARCTSLMAAADFEEAGWTWRS
ncbi:MAG: malonyl CoA-acyl carrier protein transacylase [Planctomycetota bacterium]|nr:MAG: malonyl CoA-acyl carrier protein transacylase [Planctomycetota bacterium]